MKTNLNQTTQTDDCFEEDYDYEVNHDDYQESCDIVSYDVEYDNDSHDSCDEALSTPCEKKEKNSRPVPVTHEIPVYTPSFVTLCVSGIKNPRKVGNISNLEMNLANLIVKIKPMPEIIQKPRPKNAKTLPCKFGSTCKREKCDFAHSAEEIVPTVCVKTACNNCLYYHCDYETLAEYKARIFGPKPAYTPHPQSVEKTRMCRNGLKCKNVRCSFAHTPDELRIAECMYGSNCRERATCNRLHPSETVDDVKNRMYVFRRKMLEAELKYCGLEYREDSNLCTKFANGTIEECWNLRTIPKRMAEMKYLYEYTDFPKFYGAVRNKMTFDQAEKAVMHKGYPAKWPW